MQHSTQFICFEDLFHAGPPNLVYYSPLYVLEFNRRAIRASIVRGASRVSRIIHRLRAPAITSVLPAIMAAYPSRATAAAVIVGPSNSLLSPILAPIPNSVRVGPGHITV